MVARSGYSVSRHTSPKRPTVRVKTVVGGQPFEARILFISSIMAMPSFQPSMSESGNNCLILYLARPPGSAIEAAPPPDLNLRASRIAAGARPHHHSVFNPARAEERL